MARLAALLFVTVLALIGTTDAAAQLSTDVQVLDLGQTQGGTGNNQSTNIGNAAQGGKAKVIADSITQIQSGDSNTQTLNVGNAKGGSTHVILGKVIQTQSGSNNTQKINIGNTGEINDTGIGDIFDDPPRDNNRLLTHSAANDPLCNPSDSTDVAGLARELAADVIECVPGVALANGIASLFTGKNFLTGQPMSLGDSLFKIGMGLLDIGLFVGTGGVGNLVKAGTAVTVKTVTKVVVKEIGKDMAITAAVSGSMAALEYCGKTEEAELVGDVSLALSLFGPGTRHGAGTPSTFPGMGMANNNNDVVRVRHYTNRKGLEGIRDDKVIKAQDNNRVYVESAKSKPLNQTKAEDKYQLKHGRGRDYIETDVPASKVEIVDNPRYGTPELTVRGDLPLSDNTTFTRRK